MLNVNKLALTAAKRVCDQYRFQNRMLFSEYCNALTRIKTAVGNEFELDSLYTVQDDVVLYFIDHKGNDINIVFHEYTEKRVAETFCNAYNMAKNLNSLCFGN